MGLSAASANYIWRPPMIADPINEWAEAPFSRHPTAIPGHP